MTSPTQRTLAAPRNGRHSFVIPGRAVGYYTRGARPNWKRMNAYQAWCDLVRQYARLSGLRCPLAASYERQVRIDVTLYSATRVHPDPENVRKGIVDALFYGAGKSDRYVYGMLNPVVYCEGSRVEVAITATEVG